MRARARAIMVRDGIYSNRKHDLWRGFEWRKRVNGASALFKSRVKCERGCRRLALSVESPNAGLKFGLSVLVTGEAGKRKECVSRQVRK